MKLIRSTRRRRRLCPLGSNPLLPPPATSQQLRKFDGNFGPARLQHHRGRGGTLPPVNLNDDQLLNQDDGMGGRLAGSTVNGGIVTPFTDTPQ